MRPFDLVIFDCDGVLVDSERLIVKLEAQICRIPSEKVRFLPGHDQWVIGPGTKDDHVTPTDLGDAMTRKANPVIYGGVVCGPWARRAHELVITWHLDQPPSDSSITREVERMSNALHQGLQLRLIPCPA